MRKSPVEFAGKSAIDIGKFPGDILDEAFEGGDVGLIGEHTQHEGTAGKDDAHIVGDAIVLAGLIGDGNALLMEVEGHLAVELLALEDI